MKTGLAIFAFLLALACDGSDPSVDSSPDYSQQVPITRGYEQEDETSPLTAHLNQDPQRQAEVAVRYITIGMMMFKMHTGRLPTEEEGVRAMYEEPEEFKGTNIWQGEYNHPQVVEEDPWGNAYHYHIDDSLEFGFEVWSYGPDGVESDDDILASEVAKIPNLAKMPMANSFKAYEEQSSKAIPEPVPGDLNKPEPENSE